MEGESEASLPGLKIQTWGTHCCVLIRLGGRSEYTGLAMSCLFCKIVDGSVPSTAIYSDEECYAFADIHPHAPVHVLVVPRRHIDSLAEVTTEDRPLLGHLLWAAHEVAREQGLANGYRVVINTGADGGQTVEHLHLHVLGKRALHWPPG